MAEEECGSAAVAEMEAEPYFVDFLREAPEPTGKMSPSVTVWTGAALLYINLKCFHCHLNHFFFI